MRDESSQYKFINLEYITEIADDDNEILLEIVSAYLETVPKTMNELEEALEGTDYNKVVFSAHKLKGSFRFIGAEEPASIIEKIETDSIAKGNFQDIQALFLKMRPVYENIMQELTDFFTKLTKD